MNMKVIPIIEFFLSIICIYYLFQMEDIEFSNYNQISLYSTLIIIKVFLLIYYTLMIFKSLKVFFGYYREFVKHVNF